MLKLQGLSLARTPFKVLGGALIFFIWSHVHRICARACTRAHTHTGILIGILKIKSFKTVISLHIDPRAHPFCRFVLTWHRPYLKNLAVEKPSQKRFSSGFHGIYFWGSWSLLGLVTRLLAIIAKYKKDFQEHSHYLWCWLTYCHDMMMWDPWSYDTNVSQWTMASSTRMTWVLEGKQRLNRPKEKNGLWKKIFQQSDV